MVCPWFPQSWSLPGLLSVCTPQDAACTSLLPMSFMVSLPVWFDFSFGLVFFVCLFFWLFLFSLFVFFVCFVFLHVQFCKANSRYCISQLVSLQRKFTVSCSLLRYSLSGFLIQSSVNLPLLLVPSLSLCSFSPKNHSHHCGKPPDQHPGKGLEGVIVI